VRRIQEHDSAAGLAMILYIDSVHQPPPQIEDGKTISVPPYLVLSDGWYRIKAQLDECLTRSIKRLVPGRKLAISGARLESGADGAEVLEAFDKSRLLISGNGVKLARWDARLGQQGRPYVAGLSSLSVDGGTVPLMDVMIDKVFPLAFANNDRSVKAAPWGAQEEQEQQDRWRVSVLGGCADAGNV
jgi:breast cancer 2 susceptibility protein